MALKTWYQKLAVVLHVQSEGQNLVISLCCFAEDAKKCTKIYNARSKRLLFSLNHLFSDVLQLPVAVFAVVFLSSPQTFIPLLPFDSKGVFYGTLNYYSNYLSFAGCLIFNSSVL